MSSAWLPGSTRANSPIGRSPWDQLNRALAEAGSSRRDLLVSATTSVHVDVANVATGFQLGGLPDFMGQIGNMCYFDC